MHNCGMKAEIFTKTIRQANIRNPLQFIIASALFTFIFFVSFKLSEYTLICEPEMSSHIIATQTSMCTHRERKKEKECAIQTEHISSITAYVSHEMFMTFVTTQAKENAMPFVPFGLLCADDNTIRFIHKTLNIIADRTNAFQCCWYWRHSCWSPMACMTIDFQKTDKISLNGMECSANGKREKNSFHKFVITDPSWMIGNAAAFIIIII